MPANVIDEPSASRRSVGLQLFLNHRNLWVDSDGEEAVSGARGLALCRPPYISERQTLWPETDAVLQKPFIYEIIMNAQLNHGFSLPRVTNTLS